MEKQQNNSNLVDLFTYNRELEDKMLSEYPGILKREQCKKYILGSILDKFGWKIFRFCSLNRKVLEDSLSLSKSKYLYWLVDSKKAEEYIKKCSYIPCNSHLTN